MGREDAEFSYNSACSRLGGNVMLVHHGHTMVTLWVALATPWAPFGVLGTPLGRPWPRFGLPLGTLGHTLDFLEHTMGTFWVFWAVLGRPWLRFEFPLGTLGHQSPRRKVHMQADPACAGQLHIRALFSTLFFIYTHAYIYICI